MAHQRVHIHHVGVNDCGAEHRQTRGEVHGQRATHRHADDDDPKALVGEATVGGLNRVQPVAVIRQAHILPTGTVPRE